MEKPMRHWWYGTGMATVAAVLAVCGSTFAAPFDDADDVEMTKITIPLTGSTIVTHQGKDCKKTEVVDIQNGSEVQIVAAVKKKDTSFVTVTLVDVTGIGELTNHTYIGHGSHKYTDQQIETSGAWTVDLTGHSFKFAPTHESCADSSLDPFMQLQFFNGKLRDTSTAQVSP
jgi:hypothetical protein